MEIVLVKISQTIHRIPCDLENNLRNLYDHHQDQAAMLRLISDTKRGTYCFCKQRPHHNPTQNEQSGQPHDLERREERTHLVLRQEQGRQWSVLLWRLFSSRSRAVAVDRRHLTRPLHRLCLRAKAEVEVQRRHVQVRRWASAYVATSKQRPQASHTLEPASSNQTPAPLQAREQKEEHTKAASFNGTQRRRKQKT
jgi:hypothetical protein